MEYNVFILLFLLPPSLPPPSLHPSSLLLLLSIPPSLPPSFPSSLLPFLPPSLTPLLSLPSSFSLQLSSGVIFFLPCTVQFLYRSSWCPRWWSPWYCFQCPLQCVLLFFSSRRMRKTNLLLRAIFLTPFYCENSMLFFLNNSSVLYAIKVL